jgi:hypothetical protein
MDPKVIRIISNSKIAINKGTSSGVREDQLYFIYELDPDDIIDPDTGTNLGKLEIPKGYGRVIYAQSNLSTLESVTIEKKDSYKMLIGALGNRGPEITPSIFDGVKLGDYVKKISI